MNNWKKIKLGNILTESKVEALNSNSKERIRVLLNANGVIKRPLMIETEGATKYFQRKTGQFIYGKQNLHKGAFGIIPLELDGYSSSSDLPAFDVDECCLPEWLDYFLRQGNFYESLIDIAKGAATKRIQPKELFKIEIPLPSVSIQKTVIESFVKKETKQKLIGSEIQTQKQLLTNLKQAILQDAIQGKLTEEWRLRHPELVSGSHSADNLLKRIKAEKALLSKEGKIKKEKPLPQIKKEEIPFEIPNSWAWCRLGDLCSKTGSGSTPSGGQSAYVESGIKFLRSQNIYNDGLRLNGVAFITQKTHEKMKGTKVQSEDLLLNITGGSIGRCCIVSKEFDTGNINQHVAIIRTVDTNLGYYLHNIILSSYFQKEIINVQTGAGREGLPKNKMDNMLIPLPTIEEQKAIVKKVEELMQKCAALEEEINQSETNAQMLMQAVLKEAFES